MPRKRPESSVCDASTSTCIAFAGDPIWPVQRVLDYANSIFETADGYRVVVVPVNYSIVRRLPMTLAYEDVTIANRFQRSTASEVHASLLPNGFPFKDVPAKFVSSKSVLKNTMCNSRFRNINSPSGGDPLDRLAAVVETLRVKDGFCSVSPTRRVPCSGGYCVPYLETQGSADYSSCVSEDEMFPPIADTAIEVKRKTVTINPSVAFGKPIYFGPFGQNVPSSCIRVSVSAGAFTMSDVVFDQTGCGGLNASERVPISYGGNSAAGSYISGISVLGDPAPAVTYLGNAADGDAPYLLVSETNTADAYLGDVRFQFEKADDPTEPIGLVASMARTLGTQKIKQCSREDCTDTPSRPFSHPCAEPATCSQRGCPWSVTGPGCTHAADGPCSDFCSTMYTPLGIGCRRGPSNSSVQYAFVGQTTTQLIPPTDSTNYAGISTLSVAFNRTSDVCVRSRPPLTATTCAPTDPAQQWFLEYTENRNARIHPLHRPFTCLLMVGTEYENGTAGLFPCPPCDVGGEETVEMCDESAPTYYEAVWSTALPDEPEGLVPIPVAYDDPNLVVAALPNGSCLLPFTLGIWADCRTECIRDVPGELCNGTGARPAGGLLQACKHDGSVAAIVKQECSAGGPIEQSPSASGAIASCVRGYYQISAHGRGYVSGKATINGVAVSIFTSQAIVQPYDESTAVVGIGVDVFNVTAVTALFGRAFERSLYPSNTSTLVYLVSAVLAFSLGIIMLVIAMVKVAKRKQD